MGQQNQGLQQWKPTNPLLTGNEISLYKKGKIKDKIFQSFIKAAKELFNMPDISFAIIKNAIEKEEWDENKFNDAIQSFFEKKHYGIPKPGDFLEYDKKIRIYSYEEVIAIATPSSPINKLFDCIKIDDKIRWVGKGLADKYGFVNYDALRT